LESILGNTTKARNAALSKLPDELVALMKDNDLDASLSATFKTDLPLELAQMVRNYFNADGSAIPMSLEEAKEHRIKLMETRGAFIRAADAGWGEHTYGFCEH
jgi:hypothetical protein